MVLDMFMADRDAVWRFWQAAIGESQCRPLVFWSMTLLSSTDSYSSFEKQLFTCCWSLVETKHLIMGHQVTMWLTLLIMNWALPDPPCHKVGCAHDAVKMVCTWSDPSNPEGTSKSQEKMAQISMVSTPATLPSVSQPWPMASWGVPYD